MQIIFQTIESNLKFTATVVSPKPRKGMSQKYLDY